MSRELWLRRMVLVSVEKIEGAQSERPQVRAEPVAGRCRTVTESPDLWVLGGVRWQFFGIFTFKQERLPERIRKPSQQSQKCQK